MGQTCIEQLKNGTKMYRTTKQMSFTCIVNVEGVTVVLLNHYRKT